MHAVDVCQACFKFIQECQPEQFPDIELLALFFAALVRIVLYMRL